MDNNQSSVKKLEGFSASIAQKSIIDGSKPVIAPLIKLFSNNLNGLDLRNAARKEKPVLIADIAHYLCVSHGKHPGIIEHAMNKIADEYSRTWLIRSADGFARERIYLAELTVMAGPITRIFGQDETDILIVNQSKQYKMLASSDRNGCPIGAAASFILDWHNVRELMDVLALQLDVSIPEITLPSVKETESLLEKYADNQNMIRAINFGADQILSQQRAFWNIITARATARSAQ